MSPFKGKGLLNAVHSLSPVYQGTVSLIGQNCAQRPEFFRL